MTMGMKHKPHVAFYTRDGCHLCDDAKRQIVAANCAGRYTFEEIDIDTAPTLVRRFGMDIPVVVIDGTVAFKHRLTSAGFTTAIEKAEVAIRQAEGATGDAM